MHCITFEIDAIGINEPRATQIAIEIVGDMMLALISINKRYFKHYGSQFPLFYKLAPAYEKLRPHTLSATCGRTDDNWLDAARLKKAMKGDCEEFAGYRVADLQARQGVPNAEPYILWQPIHGSPGTVSAGKLIEHRYHILVRWPEGLPRYPKSVYRDAAGILLEDPSKEQGMRVAA